MGSRGRGRFYGCGSVAWAVIAFSAWSCDGSDPFGAAAVPEGGAIADATTATDADALEAPADATASEGSPNDAADSTVEDGASAPEAGRDAADGADGADGSDAGDAADAKGCLTDLSGIGTSDFRVSFNLQTTTTGLTTLIYQRAVCAHAEFWDIHLLPGGNIGAETDNSGANYTAMQSARSVNDGAVHAIVIARVSRVLTITIDDVVDSSASSLTNFGVLPPLGFVSGDPCEAFGFAPLLGSMTGLCITSP